MRAIIVLLKKMFDVTKFFCPHSMYGPGFGYLADQNIGVLIVGAAFYISLSIRAVICGDAVS